MALHRYHKKRNFLITPEPKKNSSKKGYRSIFVVQLHDASHLHYDFRIRIGRTLKSWAIPKGPSLKITDKRLAVETEDHPLEYANFEGIIPEKQYGAGVVLIWDKGTFKNFTLNQNKRLSIQKSYENGHIILELYGEKLKGKFLLQRTKALGSKSWLLIKLLDEFASNIDIIKKMPKSVVSGVSLKALKRSYKSTRK